MNEHIAKLPKRPIIVPCYDRRCCFFGEVLGLELTKAGYDLRGRYTAAVGVLRRRPSRPPQSKAWLAENNKGWFQKAAEYLAAALSAGLAMDRCTGPPIILLACLSRLMVLPFSVKAERDQIRARDGGRRDG